MTKDEILKCIAYFTEDDEVRLYPERLAVFLEKLWNKPCECKSENTIVIRLNPKRGDKYLYIRVLDKAMVQDDRWNDVNVDYDRFKVGNCYPLSARTEVQKRCDEINAIIKKGI